MALPPSALESTIFPCAPASSPPAPSRPQAPSLLPRPRCLAQAAREHGQPAESLVQLAWALVLRHYLATPAPCFGLLARAGEALPGRAAAEPVTPRHLEAVGAVLDPDSSLSSTLASWPEPSVCRGAGVDAAPAFNTALVLGGITRSSATAQFPVLAVVDLSSAGPQLAVACEPRAVPPEQQSLVAHAFQAALEALLLRPGHRLREVDLFTPVDHQLIARWNRSPPTAVASCIHWKVAEAAGLAPDAPAVCAWDGDLTYARLEWLSSLLASRLRARGPGRGSVVALRLVKSRWAVVVMLAVVKAGGAFVSVDPTHPPARQRRIAADAGATLTLMAEELAADARAWTTPSLVVSEASLQGLPSRAPVSPRRRDAAEDAVGPGDAAYIVYTSGSTGSPKGIVVEHAALCTGAAEQARAMGIGPGSRVLQYAAYSFDVSVGDTFAALTRGVCLCVPSEAGRRDDLAGAMTRLGVSHASLTSTVAGLLDPAAVPTLRTLALGGEPVSRRNLVRWADRVELLNIYGPAECTVWCFARRSVGADDGESKIGFGIGARGWIAHPGGGERLMPVGAVGELLVEGPLLARGYLNSPAETAASFVVDPPWLRRFGPERGRRLYKTGDLVRYDAADGALVFVGRRDTKVKLCGRRIELGEVDHHLLLSMGDRAEVAVDVVQAPTGGGSVLAAFVSLGDGPHREPGQGTTSAEVRRRIADMARRVRPDMARFLPACMIPVVFVPVRAMPLSASGKTDRRRLRQICSDMSWAELLSMSGGAEGRRGGAAAKTPAEARMAEAWAPLLGAAAGRRGRRHRPRRRLRLARRRLLQGHPPGRRLPRHGPDPRRRRHTAEPPPLGHGRLRGPGPRARRRRGGRRARPGAPRRAPRRRLEAVRRGPGRHRGRTLRPGDRLARWALYREDGGGQMLVISLHHALFDGVTLHHVLEALHGAGRGEQPAREPPSFGAYLGRLHADLARREQHAAFWRGYLAGWEEARPFPDLPGPDYRPRAEAGATRFLPFPGGAAFDLGDLTLATLLRGAWSLFLARQTAAPTVVFSAFVAGRGADVPGIERLAAPTLCHGPVKATVAPGQTARSFLAALQADAAAMMPFEGAGMRAICAARDPSRAVRNLLVVQPAPAARRGPPPMPGDDARAFPGELLRGPRVDAAAMGAFHPFPLLMECAMLHAGIAFRGSFDDAVLSPAAVDAVLDAFVATVRALPAALDAAVPGPP